MSNKNYYIKTFVRVVAYLFGGFILLHIPILGPIIIGAIILFKQYRSKKKNRLVFLCGLLFIIIPILLLIYFIFHSNQAAMGNLKPSDLQITHSANLGEKVVTKNWTYTAREWSCVDETSNSVVKISNKESCGLVLEITNGPAEFNRWDINNVSGPGFVDYDKERLARIYNKEGQFCYAVSGTITSHNVPELDISGEIEPGKTAVTKLNCTNISQDPYRNGKNVVSDIGTNPARVVIDARTIPYGSTEVIEFKL